MSTLLWVPANTSLERTWMELWGVILKVPLWWRKRMSCSTSAWSLLPQSVTLTARIWFNVSFWVCWGWFWSNLGSHWTICLKRSTRLSMICLWSYLVRGLAIVCRSLKHMSFLRGQIRSLKLDQWKPLWSLTMGVCLKHSWATMKTMPLLRFKAFWVVW